MITNINVILDLLLPLTSEIRRCNWKRQQMQIRRQRLANALMEHDKTGAPIDYDAMKVTGLQELLEKQKSPLLK